jgi:hypothetical protein
MTLHEQFFPRYNMPQSIGIIQAPKINSIPDSLVQPTINLTANPFPRPSLLKGIGTHLEKYGIYYLIGGTIILLLYKGYQSRKEEEKLNAFARG